MSNTFIGMIRNIDLLYGFIYECTNLINNLYEHNNYGHLVKQLCNKFVLPIINITKNKHIKEYNKHIKDNKNVDNICLYLMNIRKFMDNNIYTTESILAPMHEFFDLSKKCYDSYCYWPCNCHCKKNNRKCVCLTDKYSEFCEEDNIILKKTTRSYFNVEYIKHFYLLQKAIDQITSKKLHLFDENACIREIDVLTNMFINVYHNSNIDCTKKIESKIYKLYQHYTY